MPVMLFDVDVWVPARLRIWLRNLLLKWRETAKSFAKVDSKII